MLTGRTVTWVSSDASIVSVSSTGVVTALKGGGVTITASVGRWSARPAPSSPSVAPKAAVVHSITLSAGATSIKIGQLTQITAVVKDANGSADHRRAGHLSPRPSAVATVSATGMAAGVSVGSATIYAKADTVTRSIGLTVIDTTTTAHDAHAADPPPGTGHAQRHRHAGRAAAGHGQRRRIRPRRGRCASRPAPTCRRRSTPRSRATSCCSRRAPPTSATSPCRTRARARRGSPSAPTCPTPPSARPARA